MKKYFVIFLIFFSACCFSVEIIHAEPQPKILATVLGDLDKDGIQEKVVVKDYVANITDPAKRYIEHPLDIEIYKFSKGAWHIWTTFKQIIGVCPDLGGKGFQSISVVKGALVIKSLWYDRLESHDKTERYRFNGQSWPMIGVTTEGTYYYDKSSGYNYSEADEIFDFNLSTGKLIYKNSVPKLVNGKEIIQKFHKEIKLAKGYKIPDLTIKKMDDGSCINIKQQLGVKTPPSEDIRYELCY